MEAEFLQRSNGTAAIVFMELLGSNGFVTKLFHSPQAIILLHGFLKFASKMESGEQVSNNKNNLQLL